MNKEKFIIDLKKSLIQHYKNIEGNKEILSYGIYTNGDASTIGIYYNTQKYLKSRFEQTNKKHPEYFFELQYFLFSMEEWKEDISEVIREDLLDELNHRIDEFGSKEYDKGNENYKDEIFDLFAQALKEIKNEQVLDNNNPDFFLHLEVSDHWIDDKMLERISTIQTEDRFLEYKEYVKNNNEY